MPESSTSGGWDGPVGIKISGYQHNMRLIVARGTNLGRFFDARDATIGHLEAHGNSNATLPGAGSSLYVEHLSVNNSTAPARTLPEPGARGSSTAFFGDHPWRVREAHRRWLATVYEATVRVHSRAERATWPPPLLYQYWTGGVTVTGPPPFRT